MRGNERDRIRLRRLGVVQKYEVEVGAKAHLQGPELAVADGGEARRLAVRSLRLAVGLLHGTPSEANGRLQRGLGQPSQAIADLHQRQAGHRAGCGNPQARLADFLAQQVHRLLDIARIELGHARQELIAEGRAHGRRVERAGVEQLVEQHRMARQFLRDGRAGGDHGEQIAARGGGIAQQREVGAAAQHGGDDVQGAGEGGGAPRRIALQRAGVFEQQR